MARWWTRLSRSATASETTQGKVYTVTGQDWDSVVTGIAFGLGFIVGPALGGLFSHISYTAPIWAAAATSRSTTAPTSAPSAPRRSSGCGSGSSSRARDRIENQVFGCLQPKAWTW